MPKSPLPLAQVTHDVCEQIGRFLLEIYGERGRASFIEIEDGQVVLRGRAPSFYQKQLWLQGALQVTGRGHIVDQIEVAT